MNIKKTYIFTAIICLIVIILTYGKSEARAPYWEQKVSLFNRLPINQNDIVFLGNSITDGGEWQEIFHMANVKNRGISSDVIDGVRERLEQVTSGHPQKIFLLIGINDVSHKLGAKAILAKYEQLVKEIRTQTPDTKLYIQSIFPINNDFKRYKNLIGQEQTVLEINRQLPELAKKYNAEYLDLWPVLSDQNGKLKKDFTNDGLHLTGNGYMQWVDAIKDYVLEGVDIIPLDNNNKEKR
ncbi:MAG: GDSL-type esterase/lipase family protein [Prevotella sp.]|nr:GDSL-type esterase/lipase family protein [Bacteroides sp.]MCM1366063.1 GDSL-type esterase/lipase family protein [Prevotella sp.]MCM1436548.1 GDSL-type esterase/lipase family protein [Prevotella sp.]